MDNIPVIYDDPRTARENGNLDALIQSCEQNEKCVEMLLRLIKEYSKPDHYGYGMYIHMPAVVDSILQQYSQERVSNVLAYAVFTSKNSFDYYGNKHTHYDGRVTKDVADWAYNFIKDTPSAYNNEIFRDSVVITSKYSLYIVDGLVSAYTDAIGAQRSEHNKPKQSYPDLGE